MRKDLICFNSFSKLHGLKISHGGEDIHLVFCKIDWLHQKLDQISKVDAKCVVISGNGDYCLGHNFHPFGKNLSDIIPKNVIKIYSQNCLIDRSHPNYHKCEPLPIGIENYHPCFLPHNDGGGCPPNAIEKYEILKNIDPFFTHSPKKFMYANFAVRSDACQSTPHRKKIRSICQETTHIDWHEPTLTTAEFYNQVMDYEAIVCAQGNGPGDNHRIYETLYLGRIPITFNEYLYERLHKNFPLVYLENSEMLRDRNFMETQITKEKSKKWNKEMLYSGFWFDMITKLGSIK